MRSRCYFRVERDHGRGEADTVLADAQAASRSIYPERALMIQTARLKSAMPIALADCFAIAATHGPASTSFTDRPEILTATCPAGSRIYASHRSPRRALDGVAGIGAAVGRVHLLAGATTPRQRSRQSISVRCVRCVRTPHDMDNLDARRRFAHGSGPCPGNRVEVRVLSSASGSSSVRSAHGEEHEPIAACAHPTCRVRIDRDEGAGDDRHLLVLDDHRSRAADCGVHVLRPVRAMVLRRGLASGWELDLVEPERPDPEGLPTPLS